MTNQTATNTNTNTNTNTTDARITRTAGGHTLLLILDDGTEILTRILLGAGDLLE